MAKATDEIRIRAVLLYTQQNRQAREICSAYGISDRTLKRWARAYGNGGIAGIKRKRPGPKRGSILLSEKLHKKILYLKQRHPSWGARRTKYQYDLPCHWITTHRIIKSNGMLVRIKPKPQSSKRFQRRYVDFIWRGDTFQFRISGTGKVYVTGFTDDRSRYRVISKAYLNKSKKESIHTLHHALKKGRVPRQIYLDNGRQFTAREFKEELARHHVRPVYGRPYHPRGRGKIERYHTVLWQELVSQVRFSSLLLCRLLLFLLIS
jgi:putative transposase